MGLEVVQFNCCRGLNRSRKGLSIYKLHIDIRSMIVFIKHRTKALNVQNNRVKGSPLSPLIYSVHNVYSIWNVGSMLNEDATFSATYVHLIQGCWSRSFFTFPALGKLCIRLRALGETGDLFFFS